LIAINRNRMIHWAPVAAIDRLTLTQVNPI
jgi:hypothetical protein